MGLMLTTSLHGHFLNAVSSVWFGVDFRHPPVLLDLCFGTGVHMVVVGETRHNDFRLF